MAVLPLVMAPDPIFKQKSLPVAEVNNEIRELMDNMLDTIYSEHGVGIAAPMVGVLKQVVVVDLQENGQNSPIFMANPQVIESSAEKQKFSEGSLCFLGISAEIIRPKSVTVSYLDYNNEQQTMQAEGFLATCLQHEIDYLHGITFLHYLSPAKRDMLTRKMLKLIKQGYTHHVHGEHCNH